MQDQYGNLNGNPVMKNSSTPYPSFMEKYISPLIAMDLKR
jgi:hypothetical protein